MGGVEEVMMVGGVVVGLAPPLIVMLFVLLLRLLLLLPLLLRAGLIVSLEGTEIRFLFRSDSTSEGTTLSIWYSFGTVNMWSTRLLLLRDMTGGGACW